MIKNCVVCGKPFEARTCGIVCSPACKKIRNQQLNRVHQASLREQARQQKQLKKGWLTIPHAPNHEINGDLVVRNKITGKILKLQKKRNGSLIYRMSSGTVTGKVVSGTPQSLRSRAVDAVSPNTFAPILSTGGGRYEIDEAGHVRNSLTKRVLKETQGRMVALFDGVSPKPVYRAVSDLLWEVHGIIREKSFARVRVTAEYRGKKFFFPTVADCVRALQNKLYYSPKTLTRYLWNRKPTIDEWKFTYHDRHPADVEWNSKSLGQLACSQRRLEGAP